MIAIELLSAISWLGQSDAAGRSPETLLRELADESARSISLKACDYAAAAFYRSRAERLVLLRTPEVQDSVESEVLRLEQTGRPVFNIEWFLMMHAHFNEVRASPRLLGLLAKPESVSISKAIEGALAQSQHITAYVSNRGLFKQEGGTIRCDPREPRDALAGVVRSILTSGNLPLNDHLYGSDVKDAELLKGSIAGGSPLDSSGDFRAIGFRFDIDGTWSKAKPILDELPRETTVDALRFEIRTYFHSKTGESCGDMWIRFARSANKNDYKIDAAILPAIVALVRECNSR